MSVLFSRIHRRIGLSSWRRLWLGVNAFCSAIAGVQLPVCGSRLFYHCGRVVLVAHNL